MNITQALCASLACGFLSIMAVAGHTAEKTKPYPHYWMSVSTANQSIPGMSSEMSAIAGLFGGKKAFGPRRDLLLQVESPQSESGAPQASHGIPPGLNMGAALPLVTPPVEKSDYVPGERGTPEKYEKPKARMLIYWGCGEAIGKGQPKVIDTARMSPADFGKAFAGRTPTRQTPPAPHKGWVYGEWPNQEDKTEVSKDGSLIGDHLVKGNYLPDIPFSLDTKRDFMAPVEFAPMQATASGAMKVEWQAIPTAIGYFASAMGHDQDSGDSIFWSASEVPEIGFGLQDYLTPADVSRFIKEKVVMDPSRTTCAVPPVFKGNQGAMLQFIAYGEELNLVQPPKPKDPKQAWNPRWSVKVRLKSTGMTTLMAGDDGSGSKRNPSSKRKQPSTPDKGEGSTPKGAEEESDSGSTKSKGGVGDRIRGIFGF
jgi:hypothetical protein